MYDGNRVMVSPGGDGKVYVVIDNQKCYIPDNPTSGNLWADNDAIQHLTKQQFDEISTGAALSVGAVLATAIHDDGVFLVTGKQKRHIHSPETFKKYGFNKNVIFNKVPKIIMDNVPSGPEIT